MESAESYPYLVMTAVLLSLVTWLVHHICTEGQERKQYFSEFYFAVSSQCISFQTEIFFTEFWLFFFILGVLLMHVEKSGYHRDESVIFYH